MLKLVIFSITALVVAVQAQAQEADSSPRWKQLFDEGQAASKRGELEEAERILTRAALAAEQGGQVDPGVVTVLVKLSNVYESKGNASEAERIYELAMRHIEGTKGRGSARFAELLPPLGRLYARHGKTGQAEVSYKEAVDISDKVNGLYSAQTAAVLKEYADFLSQSGRPNDARAVESRIQAIKSRLGEF